MPSPLCPICRQPAATAPTNPAFPFCSDRCKVVDLSRWLGGDYAIPVEEDDEDAAQSTGPTNGPPSGGGRTLH